MAEPGTLSDASLSTDDKDATAKAIEHNGSGGERRGMTMPKKNDNRVGSSDGPAVNGGRQTAQQAEIVKQEGGGRSDSERASAMGGKAAGRGNPALGGSSGGHSDQVASRGAKEGRKVAGGGSFSEQTDGEGDNARQKHRKVR